MEKILKIRGYENSDGYSDVDGVEVLTDRQIIKLFIDNYQSCCERFGYFWCNDNPQDFVGAELRGVTLTDMALNEATLKANDLDWNNKSFEGRVMFVNLETDKGTLQFVAYNEHNGYYGHDAKVQCTQLMHVETL